jgi:predicted TIM-barrel fold metal-dependent hydrolase
MKTLWGEIAVSDAHVHFFSHRFFTALSGKSIESVGSTLGWEMPPAEPERLAEQWVGELDRNGIERAALIASVPGDEDSVMRAVRHFPQRFYGYFMLNAAAPDAPDRVQQALAGDHLRGICLFPAMHRYSMAEDRIRSILERISTRAGALVFVHSGVLSVGVRKKLGLPSQFDMRFSNPIDLHSVALQFPRVNFVLPHFGAGYFREALMLCDLCPNVSLDTSSTNSWMRYEGLDLKTVFRRALEVAGPSRILFGSDSSFFPRGWHAQIFQKQAEALRELGIGADDAGLIFGGNLQRLLTPAKSSAT